ncbi:unnamed protein product [Diamesa serratosioi]
MVSKLFVIFVVVAISAFAEARPNSLDAYGILAAKTLKAVNYGIENRDHVVNGAETAGNWVYGAGGTVVNGIGSAAKSVGNEISSWFG